MALVGCADPGESEQRFPNIVLIVADDLGFADVGYHGSEEVLTPTIDSLARGGVVFEQGYVTAAVCGPSRAALLTGRYQQRFGSEDNPAPFKRSQDVLVGLPLSEQTLAERLKLHGYATAVFGKWHLGGERGEEALMPTQRGFDEFYGFLEGAALYLDSANSEQKYMRNLDHLEAEPRYFTDALGDEAVRFIGQHRAEPFFLYLPFSAVHAPLQATQEYLAPFRHVESEPRRKMLAMLYAMDANIRRVVESLEEHQLTEQTLIIFLSDNGGQPTDNYSYNEPLRGTKGQYYEGGIRVPFFIHWPRLLPTGRSYDEPVSALDVVPTVLSAVGASAGDEGSMDGVDLLPHILGEAERAPHKLLYWKLVNKRAVRDAEWKLVQHGDKIELFHLAVDPFEEENLYTAHPEVVARLEEAYRMWDASNMPALYGYDQNEFPILDERTRRIGFER